MQGLWRFQLQPFLSLWLEQPTGEERLEGARGLRATGGGGGGDESPGSWQGMLAVALADLLKKGPATLSGWD